MALSKSWDRALTVKWLHENYRKREERIPMRDGVRLYTAIYEPSDGKEHPILITRTPFALRPYGKGFTDSLRTYMSPFVKAGYIIVHQNVRGVYMSEGKLENLRPFNPDKAGTDTDEASDTFDTIEWLLANTSCNGRVGVKGMSFPGFYTTMAALSGHPALKAVSPQAPVTDWWRGDDAHINGAYQNALDGFGAYFFRSRLNPSTRDRRSPRTPDEEVPAYKAFLSYGDMSSQMSIYDSEYEFFHQLIAHPDYDAFWQERNPLRHFAGRTLPAFLIVAGLYDAEDCFGPFETYRCLKELSPATETHIAIGPWYHGAWKNRHFDHILGVHFGAGSAEYFVNNIEYPFFAKHLEGKPADLPEALWLPSEETMETVLSKCPSDLLWHSASHWPSGSEYRDAYLYGDKSLSFETPQTRFQASRRASVPLSFISDPARPVPYSTSSTPYIDSEFMAEDHSFLLDRRDVLTFTGKPLREPLRVEGRVRVNLDLAISTDDADIVVRILDRRPDGYLLPLRFGVLPLRYRNSFSHPKPVTPGEKMTVSFTLTDIAHCLMPGHSLAVQVQASCYPVIAMSPQCFLPNQYKAVRSDYKKAEITIYPGSHLELPCKGNSFDDFA